MNKAFLVVSILALLFMFGCTGSDIDKQVKKEMIDSILHLMNPEQAFNGNITLQIEKIREINPYEEEGFGLRWMDFKRDLDGEVMFYNPNGSEIHRFDSDGKYLGNLIRQGQGPGEFTNFQFLNPFFVNNQLYITGARKLAKFDKSGDFINEIKIGQRPLIFVDESGFFIRKEERRDEDWNVKIELIDISSEANEDYNETIFFQKENVGFVEKPGVGGYTNPWGIPDILYAYDEYSQRFLVCLNTDYKIYAMNLKGETEIIIEKPYRKVSVTTEIKRSILSSFFQHEPEEWQVNSFPDKLVAIKNIKSLPNGHFAVYKVTDINTFQIDVFNQEGHCIYSLTSLESIDLDEVKFNSSGFARIKSKEDGFMVYEEYRIKNLPEIFSN